MFCVQYNDFQYNEAKVVVPPVAPLPDNDPLRHEEWRVLEAEVKEAIRQTRSGRAAGLDHVRAEHLKLLQESLAPPLAAIYSDILAKGSVPRQWLGSKTILLHKKGPRDTLANYRPICLLSILLKVFSRLVLNRINRILAENTRREQAGFRARYSTIDHIHVITQLTERCREYQLPLCYVFIDFKKAFDTVEHQAVLNALTSFGVPQRYIKVIRQCNHGCTTDIHLLRDPVKVKIQRGVRQGEVISPSLFSAALETVMRKLDLPCGIDIDGERLQSLMFADDIVLIGNDPKSLETSLGLLCKAAREIGLEIHPGKTQWMKNRFVQGDDSLLLEGSNIELVTSYVYLGQSVTMDNDISGEISRRRKAGWIAFNKYRDVLVDKRIDMRTRARVFDSHVLPAMIYASETWNTTKSEESRLVVTQRAMERAMCHVSILDKIPSDTIRQRTKVTDIVEKIYEAKRRWAGHVARLTDNRWTIRVTDWYPRGRKRPLGRPPSRWSDPLSKLFGQRWRRVAKDRELWKKSVLHRWREQ